MHTTYSILCILTQTTFSRPTTANDSHHLYRGNASATLTQLSRIIKYNTIALCTVPIWLSWVEC